jgi:4-hydroxy-tetrahydrodipicolinate reductase
MARIAVCGLGTIGSQVARLLIEHRRDVELVGAASKDPGQIGRPLHEALGLEGGDGPVVADAIGPLLAERPDAIVLATGSFLPDVRDDVLACARAGVNVVSPCEELAYPYTRDPAAAEEIDAAARAGGATILGSGVNPGFIFDTLVATATGVAWDVKAIRGRRVVDTFEFGQNIHLRLGIGYTPEEFERGHEDGSIAGHVGFPESIQLVCERLGVLPGESVFLDDLGVNLKAARALGMTTIKVADPADALTELADAAGVRLAGRRFGPNKLSRTDAREGQRQGA